MCCCGKGKCRRNLVNFITQLHSFGKSVVLPVLCTMQWRNARYTLRYAVTFQRPLPLPDFPCFNMETPHALLTFCSRCNVCFSCPAEERGMYRVLVGKPEGKRPLGRPRRRWVDNIRMDLQEVGCGYMDWIGLAQDRDRWRTLVSAVMNLLVP